jgi:hypothetical protein
MMRAIILDNPVLNHVAPAMMERARVLGVRVTESDFTNHAANNQLVMAEIRSDNIDLNLDLTRVANSFPPSPQFDPSRIPCAARIPEVLKSYDVDNVQGNQTLVDGLEIIDQEFSTLRLIEQAVIKNPNAISKVCEDYNSLITNSVNQEPFKTVQPFFSRHADAVIPDGFEERVSSVIVDLLNMQNYQSICKIVDMSRICETGVWLVCEHRMFVILGLHTFAIMTCAAANTGFVSHLMSRVEAKLYIKCSTPDFVMVKHVLTYKYRYATAAVLSVSVTQHLAPSLISSLRGLTDRQRLLQAFNPSVTTIGNYLNVGGTIVGQWKDAIFTGLFSNQIAFFKSLLDKALKGK